MSSPLSGLAPELLWRHFEGLSKIPRPSKHEEAVAAHIVAWAEGRGFEVERDEIGNVLVRVPATAGREDAAWTMLQGHVDMVPVKDASLDFDFEEDPIQLQLKDGWVMATGTTLGADNGVGVAAAMAVADDPDASHGPLELLFTIDEETGMTGASELGFETIRSQRLLNLDTEEIGALYVGCAGGGQDDITLPLERTPVAGTGGGDVALAVEVVGLGGGHSGLEIGAHRANGVQVMARVLWGLRREVHFGLGGMEGGSAHNAIPKHARALIVIAQTDTKTVRAKIEALAAQVREEFASYEPGMTWKITETSLPDDVIIRGDRDRLLRMLIALPHGVQEMSVEMPGLVETSANIAILETQQDKALVQVSTRSSVSPALKALRMRVAVVAELVGAELVADPGYPSWRPNLDSALLATCKTAWETFTGEVPVVTAIHAGLECGILSEKLPGMDMISFGPTILGAHTAKERAEVQAVETFYGFLKMILAQD